MIRIWSLLKDIGISILTILKSKYKWILIFFMLWVYRVSCIPADDGGMARGLQIATTLGMLLFTFNMKGTGISTALFKSKIPNQTMTWYLLLAMMSALWSYVPTLTLYIAFEKLIFVIVLTTIFSQFKTFENAERAFVYFLLGIVIYNGIVPRMAGHIAFIAHDLQEGSCAAMAFSYCCGEMLAKKTKDKKRYGMLKAGMLLSICFLAISTSGGANASAAFGFGIALLVCGKIVWGLFLLFIGGAIYFFKDLGDNIFKFLMAGKSDEDIKSATGRTNIWEIVCDLAGQKPYLGWGHAALERYISDRGPILLVDLHSNYYGSYGNNGIIGLILLIVHHASAIFYTLGKRMKPGYVGLLCAICCGALNGYSYGFLCGKTAIITVVYFSVVVMIYIYSKVKVRNV